MPHSENYTKVDVRLRAAEGQIRSIHVTDPQMLDGDLGFVRVRIELKDERYAVVIQHFDLSIGKLRNENGTPHRASFTAKGTSPIEVAQTLGVGRALAYLGWYADGSIASKDEIDAAREE